MTTTSILQPGQMETAAGAVPELRATPTDLFSRRALRFRQLADGHSLAGYLQLCAAIAEQQQHELDNHPHIPAPQSSILIQRGNHAAAPLDPAGWPRHSHWRESARRLAAAAEGSTPPNGREPLARLAASSPQWLEAQADSLLRGAFDAVDLAVAPLIGAALQVQWTYLAGRLPPRQGGLAAEPVFCPICGSHPVASVIRVDASAKGLRYLHCSLCGTEWHVVRAKCSNCDNSKDIGYYSIEGRDPFARAETCPACRSYLKVFLQEHCPDVDPTSDDLATLALDLCMGDNNYAKSGVNFFLLTAGMAPLPDSQKGG